MNVDQSKASEEKGLHKFRDMSRPFKISTQCISHLAGLYLSGGADVLHQGWPVGVLQHFLLIQGPANAAECD